MKCFDTGVSGVTVVEFEPHTNPPRSWFVDELARRGLDGTSPHASHTFTLDRGTLRGLHRQPPPYAEANLVRCTRGAIVGVAVDVRSESSGYGDHVMVELSAGDGRALFVPPYVAHGFQTLSDGSEVTCQVSGSGALPRTQGFRWDEPEFGIAWPLPVWSINDQDAGWPFLKHATT